MRKLINYFRATVKVRTYSLLSAFSNFMLDVHSMTLLEKIIHQIRNWKHSDFK